jgi:hypothetical protein
MSDPRSPFLVAYAEWLHAKAVIVGLNADLAVHDGGDNAQMEDDDARMNRALNAVTAAEWKLMQTPARTLAEIRDRAQLVLEMFTHEIEAGEPTDGRHRLMLAALVNEIRAPIPQPNGDL